MFALLDHPPSVLTVVNPPDVSKSRAEAIAEPVGSKARRAFRELRLFQVARHPPMKAAFYPVVQEALVVLTIAILLLVAGLPVKRATGKSLMAQGCEMMGLWFREGVDPPSYYAQDLYRPERLALASGYLTRFETKNGLLTALNARRTRPKGGHEMNNKLLFANLCNNAEVAHAAILADCAEGQVQWRVKPETIDHDLFCKRRTGMGAKGTRTFRYIGENRFADNKDRVMSLSDIEAQLAALKTPMLVQPWLRNHPALADIARDSLLTVRVITCLNEKDQPEVCLAMLRLLTVLEPEWQHLPDGEYAAPITLKTGELGLLTGDSMATSVTRMSLHPVNNGMIRGRFMPHWEATQTIALQLHSHVRHRLMVGWDIAITPQGPVMLEGNTNFDVMFLQRVQDQPASVSRFGVLMNHHLDQLEALSRGTL
jgi:Sugar-transfer associated ATP-grasp